MNYDVVIVDVFNLIYRLQKADTIVSVIAKNISTFINEKLKPQYGDLWLLFDPIINTDLGVIKYFNQSTIRQDILPTYKSNRSHKEVIQKTAEFLKKYYTYRGDHVKICVSEFLEADDYVEKIINLYPNKTIALVSTDLDWARYLNDNCVLINKEIDNPFTKESFALKYKFVPTIASVTFDKAFHGDKADNITGILKLKKVNWFVNIEPLITKWIKEIAKNKDSLQEVINRIKTYTLSNLHKIDIKTTEHQLFLALYSAESKENLLQKLYDNVKVIQSRCTNLKKYTISNPENKKINAILENIINPIEVKQPFKFGMKNVS
jgi:hypothetical protein